MLTKSALRGGWNGCGGCLLAAAAIAASAGEINISPAPSASTSNTFVRTYAVGKKISDFPTNEDLSTPEAAYAAIHRAYAAEGDAAWPRLSVPELARRMPIAEKKPLAPKIAERFLSAEVIEVNIYRETNAAVFARADGSIDIRWLRSEGGKWLNHGNDVTGTMEEARKRFKRSCAYSEAQAQLSSRPPIADPEKHLRPFVEFLRREAAEPEEFLLKALARHRVVILGEVHHRPRYWDFNARLVRSPEFARRAGVIYLELPLNDQALIDNFLAAPKYDPQPVIDMLRDMLWMGWPDQPMLDFFKAVWEANQALPKNQRLRIVLVDMARPWKEIQQRSDWRKYDVDRDLCMAQNIERDLRDHAADTRHALFIVGYGHAMVNLTRAGGEPMKSAGWHLRQKLGETNVFAVFPHGPVMSNNGQTGGRIALGLFETAFAALTNRPMAFPLDHGPFGELVFDASLDELTVDPFRNGYQAYLYLGPLENEIMSPLIPGFYTDDFAKELDRRSRVSFGKGLVQGHGIKKVDGKSFVEWMSGEWGQPRREWDASQLGPLNVWELGSDWKNKLTAALLRDLQEAQKARNSAARSALQQAQDSAAKQRLVAHVEKFFQNSFRDITSRETIEWGEFATFTNGLAAIRYKYRARIWDKDAITNNQVFSFDAQGKFVSVAEVP